MVFKKKNIFLKDTCDTFAYTAIRGGGSHKKIPTRNREQHGKFLRKKFDEIFDQSSTQKQVAALQHKEGTYLEFRGQKNFDLTISSLDNAREGVRLLNVRTDDAEGTRATVYVPKGKENYFIKRVEDYSTKTRKSGNPANKDLVESIEDVNLARLEAFWVNKKVPIPTDDPVSCEIWLSVMGEGYETVESKFISSCSALEIECEDGSIHFPERMVKLIRANRAQLKNLIAGPFDIAEIRPAEKLTGFYDRQKRSEQKILVDDLLARTTFGDSNATICILDTGINAGHPLIDNALEDNCIQSVEPTWGTSDHDGHGTEMAGVALYHDLRERLNSAAPVIVPHQLESVKILPPFNSNDPKLYGYITQQAISLAEIEKPSANRVICMAVTSHDQNVGDGSPSSWSGAIDNIASGAQGQGGKRLFLVSAGNVHPDELAELKDDDYTNANGLHSIESPAQAWNAITVGAYSNSTQIKDSLHDDHTPVANVGQLSPYSATSKLWKAKWPIKPEILCDGGNMASDGTNYTDLADLSLLTTSHEPTKRLFSTIWGTSSATAQAAHMAARIMAEYPGILPETVRALLIHSAEWTDEMKKQFCNSDEKKSDLGNLLRFCGYGIPNLDRALECMNNSVNLIIEGELQPYQKGKKMKDMHLHKIPWPKEALRDLGEEKATLRVTLSYFVEPGPGEIGWKDKYRYPSCGLRFDVINHNQSREDFLKRINVKMRGEDEKDKGEGTTGNDDWTLGVNNRNVGSIHSDFKIMSAVDLCDAEYIAVYPVIGWWRERTYLKRFNSKVRYSLIVTISTPEVETDLYTPIINQIKQPITIEV